MNAIERMAAMGAWLVARSLVVYLRRWGACPLSRFGEVDGSDEGAAVWGRGDFWVVASMRRLNVSQWPLWVWSLVVLGLGLAVRLYYFSIKAGMHYPDEMFQYLEPAYWKMYGDAWLPWEYDRGVRNWIVPAYYGSLMEVGEWFGLRSWSLHRFLTLHNAIFSLLVIPAGWRIGWAVSKGDMRVGALSGLAMAVFPVFGYFAPHTLSEVHGLVLTTWAYALWLEQVVEEKRRGWGKALLIGVLLGAAFVTRYTLLVCVPLVVLDYNFRSRWVELFSVLGGFLLVIGVLGVVDAYTWGYPLASFVEYIKYNLIEDGASHHGVMAKNFYWVGAFGERLGVGRYLLLVPMVVFCWRYWRVILAWLLPLLAFSMIGHKEERFLLSIWPFVLVGAICGWVALVDFAQAFRPIGKRWQLGLAAVVLTLVMAANFYGVQALPMRWKAGMFRAQSWVGVQEDATGILVDDRLHLNGGYFLLDRSIPQRQFNRGLLMQRIYNYVAVYEEPHVELLERHEGFHRVEVFEDVVVFRRVSE